MDVLFSFKQAPIYLKKVFLYVVLSLSMGITQGLLGSTRETPFFKLPDFPITAQKRRFIFKKISAGHLLKEKDLKYSNVAEAFENISNLTVVKGGGLGSISLVSFPGAPSSGTLVLWEDMILNDPGSPNGTFDFSTLGAETFEEVEIFQGNDPILGASGTGGTIHLFTSIGKKKQDTSKVRTEIGANGLALLAGHHTTAFEKGLLKLDLTGLRTDGAPLGISPPLLRRQAYHTIALSLQGDLEITPLMKGVVLLKESESRLGSLYDSGTYFLTKSHIKALTLKGHNSSETTYQKVGISENTLIRQIVGKDVPSQTYRGNREEIRYALKHFITSYFSLQGGIGGVQEGFYQEGDKKRRTFEYLFASQSLRLLRDFELTTSGRIEGENIKNHLIYAFKSTFSYERKALSGGVIMDFAQKRPTLYELYSSNTYVQGDARLGAEKAYGAQVFVLQKELFQKMEGGVRLFERYFSKSIVGVIQGSKTFYQASPLFRTQGVEPFCTISLSKAIRLQAELTYTELKKKKDVSYPLDVTPILKATVSFSYRVGPSFQEHHPSELFLKGRFLKYKVTSQTHGPSSMTVFDGGYNYYLDAHKKIYAGVNNIFNTSYRTRLDPNIKGEPFSFYIGIEFKF